MSGALLRAFVRDELLARLGPEQWEAHVQHGLDPELLVRADAPAGALAALLETLDEAAGASHVADMVLHSRAAHAAGSARRPGASGRKHVRLHPSRREGAIVAGA
jgi:hypothetical protein